MLNPDQRTDFKDLSNADPCWPVRFVLKGKEKVLWSPWSCVIELPHTRCSQLTTKKVFFYYSGRAGVTKTNILEEIGNLTRADITNSGLSSDMIARINLSTPSDQDPTNLARSTSDFMSTQTGNHITVATDCPGKSSRSNYYSMPSRNTMSGKLLFF